MPIDAVLFDYSGVLTTGLGLPHIAMPFDVDALLVEMVAALSSEDPDPWHNLERGEMSLSDYVVHIESVVPGSGIMFDADSEHNVMQNLQVLDDRLALAADLKANGIRVGVVTNNVAEWRPLWLPKLPANLFEFVIDSAEVGCRKPESAIYELALAQLAVDDPARVVFVDDFEWNVAGAKMIGMAGIHCTATTDLGAEIAACHHAAEST